MPEPTTLVTSVGFLGSRAPWALSRGRETVRAGARRSRLHREKLHGKAGSADGLGPRLRRNPAPEALHVEKA